MIHHYFCLKVCGKWSPDTWYRKRNIASFIFASISVSASEDSVNVKFYPHVSIFTNITYIWKRKLFSTLQCLPTTLFLKGFKNLCPNFQKLCLSSKSPAFECVGMAPLWSSLPNQASLTTAWEVNKHFNFLAWEAVENIKTCNN